MLIAGGQESMTRAQHTTYLRGNKLGHINLSDTLLVDGLTDSFYNVHMGNTGKLIFINIKISVSYHKKHTDRLSRVFLRKMFLMRD